MMHNDELQREIDLTLDMMRTAPVRSAYLVGKLSALLWVQAGGDVLRTDAHELAERAWRRMQGSEGDDLDNIPGYLDDQAGRMGR